MSDPSIELVIGRRSNSATRTLASILVLVTAIGAAGVIWHADPAAADPLSRCSTTTGEIVVVDFSPWGGDIERGCAATLTTGYNAMISAGFTPAGDEHDGPGFICRIDDEPPPSEESCVDTPPASASWSYWHADAGQNTWTYSFQGAMSYEPPPGSVDAWTFGATNPNVKPPFSPSSVRANNPGPPTTTTTTTTPSTTSTTESTPGTSPRATTPTTAPTTAPRSASHKAKTSGGHVPSPTARTTETSGSHGAGTTKSPGTSTQLSSSSTGSGATTRNPEPTPKIVNVSAAPAVPKQSAGSAVPFLLGAAAVVCLAGAAGLAAWRRRRAETS